LSVRWSLLENLDLSQLETLSLSTQAELPAMLVLARLVRLVMVAAQECEGIEEEALKQCAQMELRG
jgi:hypothetical protein